LSTEGIHQPYDLEELDEVFDTEAVEVDIYEKEGSVEIGVSYSEGDQDRREQAMESFKNQLSGYLQSTSTEPYIDGNIVLGPHRGKFRANDENLRTVQRGVAGFLRKLESYR